MTRLAESQRIAVLADLRSGRGVRATAAAHGCSPPTVSRIARAAGLDVTLQAAKKAAEARKDWAAAERLDLLNRLFAKAESMLDGVGSELHLQQLTMAVAVLIDKRRLEDGEATSRADVTHSGEEARGRIARRLDELAARRRADGAA